MDKQTEALNSDHQIQMLTLILSENQCHKCVRLAKEKNIRGGMVTIGKGTVNSAILNLLGIKSQKKEIVKFLLSKEKTKEILDYFTDELQLHEPGHGIAFTTPVMIAAGHPTQEMSKEMVASNTVQGMEDESMFKKLTVIVDRGMAEDVMDIARKAGVRGGTILHGRGAGVEFAAKLFGMEIEPEKELVLMLTPSDLIEKVVNELTQELRLNEPGKGILFVEPIVETRGLFELNSKKEHSK